jgi:hypothetical protein
MRSGSQHGSGCCCLARAAMHTRAATSAARSALLTSSPRRSSTTVGMAAPPSTDVGPAAHDCAWSAISAPPPARPPAVRSLFATAVPHRRSTAPHSARAIAVHTSVDAAADRQHSPPPPPPPSRAPPWLPSLTPSPAPPAAPLPSTAAGSTITCLRRGPNF